MEHVLSNFGKNMKRALVDKGMKQCELADAVGLSYHTISKLARGEQTPGAETLIKIADALGVTVDLLVK